ncbi:restriction endonuclease subunit S [Bacteroides fragilis]|nr:restriction endonuclease subunit S [Bacteroides fragilis]MCE8602665.1 restriction endonuclease subunit S [Bacteroides fragilis]MCE8609054.1 restriction endonuclease subunit S [Bacteroides fragilis]MCE8667301.1 restriction endonuclease subunit S [Bacteroides fragilis]MCE8670498.1 restriction endonuclease subunit S [Bacteroides fragilis]
MSSLLVTSDEKLSNAKQLYLYAEDILLEEFGLKDWKPQEEAVSVKSFADFTASGRLDAEYYQPKYDDLFVHLKKYETKPLSQIATISKSIEPGSDAYQESGIPFVRVSNLSKFGLSDPDIHLDRATYETDELKPKKDTILLSKDGSVGIAYKLEQDLDAITSGAILHLKITDKEFLPDYLTLVLNSIIVKMQAERDAGGSIIQHWKPSEIEQVIIPKLSGELQTQIAEKVQESFALKAESKRLLDLAKTAVETAIEHGEDKAIELLNN